MTGGMAGIAGTVLVLYTQFLSASIPDAAGHFIIASVLSAPLAMLIGQIMVPDGARRATAARSPIRSRSRPAAWTRSPRAPPRGSRCCST